MTLISCRMIITIYSNELFTKLGKILTSAGTNNVVPCLEDELHRKEHLPSVGKYFNIMLQLASHSSIVASYTALEFWDYILKQDFFRSMTTSAEVVADLLRVLAGKLMYTSNPGDVDICRNRLSDTSLSTAARSFYAKSIQSGLISQIEFDLDYSEFDEVHTVFCNRTNNIMKNAAIHFPGAAVKVVSLQRHSRIGTDADKLFIVFGNLEGNGARRIGQ